MVEQLRFLFFQIENLVSSNNQILTKLLFSYFDLDGVSDKTNRQIIFSNQSQSAMQHFFIDLIPTIIAVGLLIWHSISADTNNQYR